MALKKTADGWKSNKRQKAESKAAAANKQARTETPSAEQEQGAAPTEASAAAPARAQVRVPQLPLSQLCSHHETHSCSFILEQAITQFIPDAANAVSR